MQIKLDFHRHPIAQVIVEMNRLFASPQRDASTSKITACEPLALATAFRVKIQI